MPKRNNIQYKSTFIFPEGYTRESWIEAMSNKVIYVNPVDYPSLFIKLPRNKAKACLNNTSLDRKEAIHSR